MIKFFRRIRKNLIKDNKTNMPSNKISRYLFYALGEIILVVIGILIAVGINSIYNASQNEEKIKAILRQVQQELVVDINDAKRIYNFYIEKDSLYRKIMNGPDSFEEFKKEPYPLVITTTYVSFSNKRQGYRRIMDNIENLPEKYNSLLPHFSSLYIEMQNDIDDYNTFIKNTTMVDGREILKTNPKLADYQWDRFADEAQESYFNDPFLKNRTFKYINDLENIAQACNSYRAESILLYKKIDSLLDEKPNKYQPPLTILPNPNQYESFLGDYKAIMSESTNEINIVLESNQLTLKQSEREDLKLFWHEGDYYFGDFGIIFKLYTDNSKNFLEVRTPILREVYIKT